MNAPPRARIADLLRRVAGGSLKGETLPPFSVEEPSSGIQADYASNLALLLARQLKKAPRQIAEELADRIGALDREGVLEKVEAAPNGFLNFYARGNVLRQAVSGMAAQGQEYFKRPASSADQSAGSVLIEFVSANPTGPLHIGHGRGAALGDSLARIYRQRGFPVETEYYVNDMGIQMQILAQSVQARLEELEGRSAAPFPENGYQGDYIRDIARRMAEEKRRDFDQFPRQYLLDWIRRDLEGFGVAFDHWFPESGLHQRGRVEAALQELGRRGFLKEQEGALWFSSGAGSEEKEMDKDRVLRKSDGRYTYFASDIAYHREKFERKYKTCIDIWGHDHHGYVPRVESAMAALGAPPGGLKILLYQLVSLKRGGKRVAMSTRSGEFVTLHEIVEEVGRDASRFFFAMRSPSSQLEFDVDLAKKQSNENPVFYVQYVHARICSIFREAEKRGVAPAVPPAAERTYEKEERDLVLKLNYFEDTLDTCLAFSSPHFLATYLMDLATRFHKFYDRHRVLEAEPAVRSDRLEILKATQAVVQLGLSLLGVSAPDKM